MVYLPVLAAAIALALLLGGRLSALAELRLHGLWLLYTAVGLQLIAFPSGLLPWETGAEAARWLWLASYGCLLCGAALNFHLRGVVLVAAGMMLNVVAIVANGGRMPALPDAADAAGIGDAQHNSLVSAEPSAGWLVDRWAAPDWVPFANVFSVGDVVLACGAFVVVLAAMDVPLLRRLPAPRIALR